MLILAIDTALAAATAVVASDGVVVAARCEPMARGHQEAIAALAAEAMAEASAEFRDLERIGVTLGPGSFTGLRVGLAFAKGMALAWDTPLVGMGSLDALAYGAPNGRTAAVIDAGRGHIYRRLFDAGVAVTAPEQIDLETARAELTAFSPATLIGSGAPLFTESLPDAEIVAAGYPSSLALAALTGKAVVEGAPSPLYLRAPDAKTLAERGVVR